ncbi:hypothetical protein SAMN04488128_1011538 [Chitinophaga eiseniae]|uniref:Uncharacterized protein n=1 Tax=Chitinophaga eiseniae TaxID=634771 RepID=A0A1T4ND20_9BACT|nr:hypothetical protein [Chitinophaga eiseniae]SJZ77189.1 hypothetical protein SAMN04488128_1011538 [Chitinophaga eiseniae]
MNKDKEKDIDQQSNPSFTKEDLLGKQEQSEPAEQQGLLLLWEFLHSCIA